MKPGTTRDLQHYKHRTNSRSSQSQTANINLRRRFFTPKLWDFLMGICVSTKNTMKVRDIPEKTEIVVNTIELQDIDDCETDQNQCDFNKISVYKSPTKETMHDLDCKRLSLPIKSDDDSIKCNQDDFTQLPAKTSLQNIQNNVQNDYYSEMSDDSDNQSVLDGGDYLWIPNTLACHMGIHRHSRFLQVSV